MNRDRQRSAFMYHVLPLMPLIPQLPVSSPGYLQSICGSDSSPHSVCGHERCFSVLCGLFTLVFINNASMLALER